MLYTSVGVTSAFAFERDLSFLRSNRPKTKRTVSLFHNVVLCPTAPSASDDITAYGQIAGANLDKIFEIISQKK